MSWAALTLAVLQYAVAPLLAYGTWVLRDIRTQLRFLNGRMIDMERWRTDHDKTDDERFDRLHDDLRASQKGRPR